MQRSLIVRRTKFFSFTFVFSKGITVWRYGLDYDGISYSHGFLVLDSRLPARMTGWGDNVNRKV